MKSMNNPLISIIFCISLIICISISQHANYLILVILMAYAIYEHCLPSVIKAIIRVRWILLFIVLITCFTTPGEVIQPFIILLAWLIHLTPTYEGLYLGVMQSIRLICLIVVISLMTSRLRRDELISAFYHLLAPLSVLGFNAERFAARLCLTLEYIQKPQTLSESLIKLNALRQVSKTVADDSALHVIELALIELNSLGFAVVFCIALLPFLVIYYQ